ncbi:DNA internalization-related competence protein ComEC/Rec2 [Insulibacter thermoxylanivorax]|uniref:DNA internalization-related competence protein ComEC/Rec2 n=1 Tax=Insulibacter thermoxylanivorax TaxID=2749268 RepID=A0A916VGB8_9BACL|nr:DNA internalization-related competence protein ComEC/Rec2 [Insulibacter thermoxylanivorax]GFR37370.1 DNA internalization-related competence protein ComEC/Rec2 [Insulibacter thermoxylanivorax]
MRSQAGFYGTCACMIGGLAAGLAGRSWAIGCVLLFCIASLYYTKRSFDDLSIRHRLFILSLTLLSIVYGLACEQMNRTSLPDAMNGRIVEAEGTIVSGIKLDGDRLSFQYRVSKLRTPDARSAYSHAAGRGTAEEDVEEIRDLHEKMQVTIYLESQAEQQEAASWIRGMEIRLTGELQIPSSARNFGDFDYRSYLKKQRIHWQIRMEGMSSIVIKSRPGLSGQLLLGSIDRFRNHLTDLVWSLYDERYAGFMQGLLIGDQQRLPQDLYDQFSDIGMTHVLAISGLHVGVFTAGCFWMLKLLRLTREKIYAVSFALVPMYVLGTGASPSAVRAGLMAMLGLVALRLGRWKDTLRFLLIAAVGMLMVNPYFLYNISFQLSFVVTFGLILLVPRIAGMIRLRSAAISGSLAVTAAAQIFSFPIVIYYFHLLHLLSPAANLLLVPLVSVLILPLGMLSLLLGVVHTALGAWPAAIASLAAEGLFRAVEWTAGWQGLLTIWPRVPFWWIAAYYLLILFLFIGLPRLKGLISRRLLKMLVLLTGSLFISLLLYAQIGDRWRQAGIVSVLDVGQGDAILIRTPHGRHLLIDGGGTFRFGEQEAWRARRDPYEVGKDTLVPLLRRRGIQRLDAVIATHLDADHIGGLHAVLENIPTERILYNGTTKDSAYADRLVHTAREKGIPLIRVSAGRTWQADKDTRLQFLHPIVDQEGNGEAVPEVSDQNGASVVFLLQMQDASFLLTGDIGSAEERKVIDYIQEAGARNVLLPDKRFIDVLKVAHHGSRYSTSDDWLGYWQPAVAAISVGRNSYGHPSEDVLGRLMEHGVKMYRTDEHGEIQFMSSGGKLYLRTKYWGTEGEHP